MKVIAVLFSVCLVWSRSSTITPRTAALRFIQFTILVDHSFIIFIIYSLSFFDLCLGLENNNFQRWRVYILWPIWPRPSGRTPKCCDPFMRKKLNYLYTRMFLPGLVKISRWCLRGRWKCEKLTDGQTERDKQTDRQTDRKTERRRTTNDQKKITSVWSLGEVKTTVLGFLYTYMRHFFTMSIKFCDRSDLAIFNDVKDFVSSATFKKT